MIQARTLTPTEKGGIAELAIAAKAAALGIQVLRPMTEGHRYDLVFEIDRAFSRVQCKWARLVRGAVEIRGSTCRNSPVRGYIRGSYEAHEVDLLAAYCSELDRVSVVPIAEIAGRNLLHLRVEPARNNQARLVHWASRYELGAIAQLGERRHGMAEVEGSSPSGSTPPKAA